MKYENNELLANKYFNVFILLFISVVLMIIKLVSISLWQYLISIVVAVFLVTTVVEISKLKSYHIFEEMGIYTLPIYLMHPFFVVINRLVIGRYLGDCLYMVVASVISIVGPYLCYKYVIKKIAFLDFLISPKYYMFDKYNA